MVCFFAKSALGKTYPAPEAYQYRVITRVLAIRMLLEEADIFFQKKIAFVYASTGAVFPRNAASIFEAVHNYFQELFW